MNWGGYAIDLFVVEDSVRPFIVERDIVSFVISNKMNRIGTYMGKEPGDIRPVFDFVETKIG